MIKQRDFKRLRDLRKTAGEIAIGRTRRCDAAGVVMRDHDCVRVQADRIAENLAHRGACTIKPTVAEATNAYEFLLSAEIGNIKALSGNRCQIVE